MDFPFDLGRCVGAPEPAVPLDDRPESDSIASGAVTPAVALSPFVGRVDEALLKSPRGRRLGMVLEALGKGSALAQGLHKPVTDGASCMLGQRAYLLVMGSKALGLLKVGVKRLYVALPPSMVSMARSGVQDALQETSPLCALDFYVHESCQRSGYGKLLFDAMLHQEHVRAEELAYDRPSPKLMAFLRKFFGLQHYRPQNNNFVLFDEYWASQRKASTQGNALSRASAMPQGAKNALPVRTGSNIFPGTAENLATTSTHVVANSDCTDLPVAARKASQMPSGPQGRRMQASATPWATDNEGLGDGRPPCPGPCGGARFRRSTSPRPRIESRGSRGALPCALPPRPPLQELEPAGMPSRATSLPAGRGRSHSAWTSGTSVASADPAGSGHVLGALCSRSLGSAASRYESPLSHAGHSMLRLS